MLLPSYIELTISSDWPKMHSEVSKLAPVMSSSCRLYNCLSFDNMFKTEFIKLLQAINTCYLDTYVTMLYSAIKVQVRD